MAINQISTSNTFQQWVTTTSSIISTLNAFTNYTATTPFVANTKLSISGTGSFLDVTNNAAINAISTNTVTFSDGTKLTTAASLSASWTPVLTNTVRTANSSSTFKKTLGSDATWDSQIYSTEGYVRGCYVTFVAPDVNKQYVIGFSSSPTTNSSFGNVEYGIRIQADGNFTIWEGVTAVTSAQAYTAGAKCTITYDGQNVRYYVAGALKWTTARTPGNALYLDSSFYTLNAEVQNLIFGAMGESGIVGYNGSNGYAGSVGYVGSQGVIGYTGSLGYTGSASTVQGPIGYTGSTGTATVTGSDTQVLYINGSAATGAAGMIYNNTLNVVDLKYRKAISNLVSSTIGATVSSDLAQSSYFKYTITAGTNPTITFINPPANTNNVYQFSVMIVQPSSSPATSVTFANTVKWSGGTQPPITSANNAVDVWSFVTFDGGSTYYGTLSMKDAK